MTTGPEAISRNVIRQPCFVALATALALVAVGVLDVVQIHLGRWLRPYSQTDLIAARTYVDTLPASAAPTLFSTDLRTFHSYGERNFAESGIADFQTSPADESWNFSRNGWTVDVVVLPGFTRASLNDRREMLAGAGVPHRAMTSLLSIKGSEDGCQAGKNAPFGWNDDGVVLADPMSLLTEEEVLRCLFSGLAFVNGFPIRDDRFSFAAIPSRTVIEITLDYVMRCARDGVTDEQPALRSRAGITGKPSISCIRKAIEEAIRATRV
jgi:hypothetical protein